MDKRTDHIRYSSDTRIGRIKVNESVLFTLFNAIERRSKTHCFSSFSTNERTYRGDAIGLGNQTIYLNFNEQQEEEEKNTKPRETVLEEFSRKKLSSQTLVLTVGVASRVGAAIIKK